MWDENNLRKEATIRIEDLWGYLFQTMSDSKTKCYVIEFDMCMYDQKARCHKEWMPIKKPTRLLTNCRALTSLRLKCDGAHDHVHARGSFAKAGGVYTKHLCSKWAQLLSLSI